MMRMNGVVFFFVDDEDDEDEGVHMTAQRSGLVWPVGVPL